MDEAARHIPRLVLYTDLVMSEHIDMGVMREMAFRFFSAYTLLCIFEKPEKY
jgi:hypothetical protein